MTEEAETSDPSELPPWGTCITLSAGTLQAALLGVDSPPFSKRWASLLATTSPIPDLLAMLPPRVYQAKPGQYRVTGLAAATKVLVSHLRPEIPVECVLINSDRGAPPSSAGDLAMFSRQLVGASALMAWLCQPANWMRWHPLAPLTGEAFGKEFGVAREKGRHLLREAERKVEADQAAMRTELGKDGDA